MPGSGARGPHGAELHSGAEIVDLPEAHASRSRPTSPRRRRPLGAERDAGVGEVPQRAEVLVHAEHVEREPVRRFVGSAEREVLTARRPGQVERRETLQPQGVELRAIGAHRGDRERVLEGVLVTGEERDHLPGGLPGQDRRGTQRSRRDRAGRTPRRRYDAHLAERSGERQLKAVR